MKTAAGSGRLYLICGERDSFRGSGWKVFNVVAGRRRLIQHVFPVFVFAGIEHERDAADIAADSVEVALQC